MMYFKSMDCGKAKESGTEVRDGVSALSCTQKDGGVEVSLFQTRSSKVKFAGKYRVFTSIMNREVSQ